MEALVKLSTDNKSFPVHDWLYSTVHHSHPGLLERIDTLQKSE
jgi:STE24 endopeptidase